MGNLPMIRCGLLSNTADVLMNKPFSDGSLRKLLWISFALAASLLPACSAASEGTPDYRYRLTVEIETPEGLRTGSSVIEVATKVAGPNSIPTPGKVSHRVKGDAVAVDLGKHGTLFALLESDDNVDWPSYVMFRLSPDIPLTFDNDGKFDAKVHFKARFAAMLNRRELIEVPKTFPDVGHLKDQSAWPMFVGFGNIADPRSIRKIDPDDLSASFGNGVKLKRITVQLTDDPVTTGIEKQLTWLPEVYKILGGKTFQPEGIPVGDFQRLFSTKDFR